MFFGLPDKFWKHNYYSSLHIKDLLTLIQTCKYFNKQKKYIYRIIYCKLINSPYLEIHIPGTNIAQPHYFCRDLTIHTNNVKVIREVLTLLNNNEYLRNMFIKSNSRRKCVRKLTHIVNTIYDKKITIYTGSREYREYRDDFL